MSLFFCIIFVSCHSYCWITASLRQTGLAWRNIHGLYLWLFSDYVALERLCPRLLFIEYNYSQLLNNLFTLYNLKTNQTSDFRYYGDCQTETGIQDQATEEGPEEGREEVRSPTRGQTDQTG